MDDAGTKTGSGTKPKQVPAPYRVLQIFPRMQLRLRESISVATLTPSSSKMPIAQVILVSVPVPGNMYQGQLKLGINEF